ncbi:MAG: hypothetical protein C0467_27585 [Planctomycetaceae bacterium]|nr:hypothetical protein [Planctomycetaceae bacterium]
MFTAIAPDELALAPENPVPPEHTSGLLRRAWALTASVLEWLFGLASLLLGLAILASVLVGQFLVLGYLLEVCGRVARSGRFRDGFIGVRTFARLGGIAIACGLLWLPLYGMSIFAENAAIIDPYGPATKQWKTGLTVLATLYVLHVVAACLRGARFRDFFRPLNLLWLVRRVRRGGSYSEARDRFWDFVVTKRLPYYFWFGVRGFVGAFLWLAIPLALLGQGHRNPALGIVGAMLLAVVVMYLPFLQARFARDNRLRAYRELRPVREEYRRAPLAFSLALVIQLLAAVPLYLLKIEAIPRDLIFLEGVVFLAFIFPARLVAGWAYSRPARREVPRHWTFRWGGRLLMLPAIGAYVLVVFASQHIGWQGISSLYQQHAFLLPVPFVNWNG